ncbi:hypothetical protein [Sphingobium nicotianae]|uniref:Uncharacterized protein n=1 Tax=Sphingobium nicotianae TaxID=2782607 RepID=A0A9X1AIG4_9SPHN|nr:hypothetical protein [Sphingobium nicotianae]MBT2185354.1 hypothetical protein [Sphingobium nicotianae]
MSDALATAAVWRGLAETYLATYWREVGLIAAMIILSGLLFWRLGERSRHADQELVLDFDALPLVEQVGADAMHEPETLLADRMVRLDAEIEPEGLPLPTPVAARNEAPLVAEGMLDEDMLPHRHFGSLREAIEAMKADMAAADNAKSAISA